MATIKTNVSRFRAMSFAVAHDGSGYFANGLDLPQRWDGQTAECEDAGLAAPTSVCDMAAQSTAGTIWGDLQVYCRYVDDAGIPSNFSAVTSIAVTSGDKTQGFRYTNVPQPSGRQSKTEIWRNTRGQTVTWYLDVDNSPASTSTAKTDGDLIDQSSLRFVTAEGWPNANRFTQPPDWASVVVSFQNRTWWAVPVDYTWGDGTVSTTTSYVKVTGAKLTSPMAGRTLHASGFLGTEIDSIDSDTSLTLTAAPSEGFGTAGDWHSISTDDEANYNTLLFSEAGEPESVPTTNALTLQKDGDRLTGMLPLGAYLFLLKHRHIYRGSTAGDPRRDMTFMLAAQRGCLNQQCWCRVQGAAFLLDRQGCYVFAGSDPVDISGQIADWFQKRVNWSAEQHFHIEHSPEDHTVRCIVAVDQDYYPQDVFAYNYQLGQWHHEGYPFKLGASVQAPIGGQERVLVGMEEQVALMGEGVLDGPSPGLGAHQDRLMSVSQTTRGTVTSATTNTITDTAANFDFSGWSTKPQDVGTPVYVIDSAGDWNMRRIASINSTSSSITFQRALSAAPAVGETYQIGGIEYQGKWGSFALPEYEQEQVRRALVRFQPQHAAGKVNLRKYFDHTSAVETAHIDYDSNIGVKVESDSGNIQLDLERSEGVLFHRFDGGFEAGSPAQRSIEIELKGVSGEERAKLYEVVVDGVKR